MEEDFPFHFSSSAGLLSLLGTLLFLLDVALDIWAIVSLYQEGEYVYMGVLIAILLCSSALVHIYSWMWYPDPQTSMDTFASKWGLVGPLHVVQLGLLLRFASMVEISIRKLLKRSGRLEEGVASYLKSDLSTLRLFETFSESVPQLVLMITIVMHEHELQLFTGFKILGSLVSVAISVLFYHRDMRDFLPEEQKMGWSSSVVFFSWNLLLITPRLTAVALLAFAWPCFVPAHFLCLWLLLLLWAWRQKTDFMDSDGGEWLYRATVGLIWYFSWFNVSAGSTKVKNTIYHVCMGADTGLLLGLWFWRTSVESARHHPSPINPYVVIGALPALYITGLLVKVLYYRMFHPKRPRLIFEDAERTPPIALFRMAAAAHITVMETDSADLPMPEMEPRQPGTAVSNRMRNLAVNFYN